MFYHNYWNALVSRIQRAFKTSGRHHYFDLRLLLPFMAMFLVGFQGNCGSSYRYFRISVGAIETGESLNALAVDPRTGNLFVGGAHTNGIGDVLSSNIAFYKPVENQYSALSERGLNGSVNSMVLAGDNLFVGGEFTATSDGTPLNKIAHYDLVSREWSPLPNTPLNGNVYVLVWSGTSLYVGGEFSVDTGVGPLSFNIARYNFATNAWESLENEGLNGEVRSIAAVGNYIFVGGFFSGTVDGAIVSRNIVRYDPAEGSWTSLPGGGLNNGVLAITHSGNDLYVGGSFTATHDSSTENLNAIGRLGLQDNVWRPLERNGLVSKSFGVVRSLTTLGRWVWVGGTFSSTHDGLVPLKNIAKYDSISQIWSLAATNHGLSSTVNAVAADTYVNPGQGVYGRVFACGAFRFGFDANQQIELNGLTFYDEPYQTPPFVKAVGDEGTWEPLGFTNTKALNAQVNAIELAPDGKIYAGGTFNSTADGTTELKFIARFDPATKTWSPLANNGLAGPVEALAIVGNDLYVGGSFLGTNDGTVFGLNRIARYDLKTNTWHPLTGDGLNAFVRAFVVSGNTLFVGGGFTATAAGTTTNINRIARYDTQTGTWSTLTGNGLNNFVNALAISGNDLYVGGIFTNRASGGLFNLWRMARYDISTDTWFQVGNFGLNGPVSKLGFYEGALYVNGEFTQTIDAAVPLDRLGRYDPATSTWTQLSGDPEDYETAVATSKIMRIGNDVYIAGNFTQAGGTVSLYLAQLFLQQWDITTKDTNWFNDNNWTTGAVPGFNTNAVVPDGSGSIEIATADVVLDDLNFNGGVLNIGAGRTLTINGILALNGGIIEGDGTLVIASCQPDGIMGRGGNETSYIKARLVRYVNNSGTFNYPIGTANSYSPVTIKKITGSGDVGITAVEGAYPDTSGLPENRLARWWSFENIGGISAADAYLGYSDNDITGTEANYRAFHINGGKAVSVPTAVNTFSNITFAPGVSTFTDWTLAEAPPTAAAVEVSGRVFAPNGYGHPNAAVTMTDMDGNVLNGITSSFGYFRFEEVPVGGAYVISVASKHYSFTPRIIKVFDTLTDVDFVGEHSK